MEVELEGLDNAEEALLGLLTDLLIEGGALEVSYSTTKAALGGGVVMVSLTVPTTGGGGEGNGGGDEEEEDWAVDVEVLVRLALEQIAAAAAGGGGGGGGGAAVAQARFTVHDAPILCGVDWMRAAEAGEQGFDPVLAGKFLVVPVQRSGLESLPPQAEHELRILPGEGWGTGQHPTTRLCLDFLSRDGVMCGGERVIDYGCGSGILSIAAVQLGAMEATGVDIEYEALASARVNTLLNNVEAEVELLHAREVVPGEFAPADVVVANILVGVLVRMVTTIVGAVKPGGWLVLSGLRPEQLGTIREKYAPYIDFEDELEAQEEVKYASWGTGAGWWVRLVGRRKNEGGGGWLEALSEAAVS